MPKGGPGGFVKTGVLRCACDPRGTMRRIALEEAHRFQHDLKILPDVQAGKLDESMATLGFITPLFLWFEHDAILDGTQRRDRLEANGWTVDGGIPVVEIEATDEKDAAQKLLVIASQYGQVEELGLVDFLDQYHVDVAQFTLPDLAGVDWDDVVSLMGEAPNPGAPDQQGRIKTQHDVLIVCEGESGQADALEKLTGMGFECRAITS